MKDNRLISKENYSMKDGGLIKGSVVIRKEDGTIIFKGNNMVVKTGRHLLMNLFLAKGSLSFSDMKMFIGNKSTMVAANDTFEGFDIITNSIEKVVDADDDFMTSATNECNKYNVLYYTIDTNNLCIHMGVNYKPVGSSENSTLGLCFKEENVTKLFSRIVFPRRILSSDTPLIIDYYLYF